MDRGGIFHSNRQELAMAYEANPRSPKAFRVVLESYSEGVYVFVFHSATSTFPETDTIQDNYEMAKKACEEDFGIKPHEWKEIRDLGLR
jgi:hypothetical protein